MEEDSLHQRTIQGLLKYMQKDVRVLRIALEILAGVCRPQEAEEYEAKLKEVQEEQATYRKALELELKKLRTEVR